MRTLIPALCFVSLLGAVERYSPDWKAVEAETLEHYVSLLRIDTRNPPGNETRAVEYVKRVLDRAGIPYQVFALDPNRANLVARIKGNGSKRPIIIMGHTDVVGVQREKWTVDPFAAVRKNGVIYGRGAQDDKDNLTASLMVTLLLKRLTVPLDRDVIFVAEAGEEATASFGIDFLVQKHWNAIEAEYALAEGGRMTERNGKIISVEISTTEKVPRTTRLVAHGTAGHGSVPRLDNPLLSLSAAVAKFHDWQPPMRLNDTTRTYFERLATIAPPERAERYSHVTVPNRTGEIQAYFAAKEPAHYSMLRTSVVPTIIKAGFRSNVIPSDAEATLDIRALPDENMEKLYAELRRVISDPHLEIVPSSGDGRPASAPSRLDTAMFRAIEQVQKRMFPGAVTLPTMLTGATDMAQLRAKGVQCYGVGPLVEGEGGIGGAHTDDEHLSEAALHQFVQFLWNSVVEIAAANGSR